MKSILYILLPGICWIIGCSPEPTAQIQPESGEKQVVFDITRITHNSTDPSPDGVSDFNPIKLYTSKKLIDYMNSQGKTLQIYWDDFKLWKNKVP